MACAFPWFKFYAVDWETDVDVCMMSLMQKGIYISLLTKQWMADGIPDDKTIISWLIRLEDEPGTSDCSSDLEVVLKKFPAHPSRPGYLANPKLLQLYEDSRLTRERMTAAGAKGGSAKRAPSKAKAKLKQSSSRASQSESESESYITTTWDGKTADEWFAQCKADYPKRPGNNFTKARSAWDARVKKGVPPPALWSATRGLAVMVNRESREPKMIPMAATFYGPSFDPDTDYGPVGIQREQRTDEFGELQWWRQDEAGEWNPEAAA